MLNLLNCLRFCKIYNRLGCLAAFRKGVKFTHGLSINFVVSKGTFWLTPTLNIASVFLPHKWHLPQSRSFTRHNINTGCERAFYYKTGYCVLIIFNFVLKFPLTVFQIIGPMLSLSRNVCPCVRLCVSLFTFNVPFKCLFFPHFLKSDVQNF